MYLYVCVALLTYTMFKHLSSNKEKKPESDLGPIFPESFGFFRAMRGEQGKGRWRLREAWETGAEGGVDRWMGGGQEWCPRGRQGGAQRGKGQNLKWWTMNSAWNTASGHLYTAIRSQKLPPPHTRTRTHTHNTKTILNQSYKCYCYNNTKTREHSYIYTHCTLLCYWDIYSCTILL